MAPVDRFVLPRQAVTGAAPSIWWHDVKAGLEKVTVLVVGRGFLSAKTSCRLTFQSSAQQLQLDVDVAGLRSPLSRKALGAP